MANGEDWKQDLTFEYMGRETPHRNHLVKVGFRAIGGRARLMLHKANIPDDIH